MRHRGDPQQRDAVVKRPKHSFDEGILATVDQRRIEFGLGFQGCQQVVRGERSL
jgi:hypothetical protein